MAKCNYVIFDTQTGLYLTSYNQDLSRCTWGNVSNAVCFATQAQADSCIVLWGQQPGQRFVGQNPPPR